MTTEWKPEGFNILDYRDFSQDDTPYVLRFRFPRPVVFYSIRLDVVGWNLPECKTNILFSKINISKNGFDNVYYSSPGGNPGRMNNMKIDLNRDLVATLDDVVYITLFPACPIHMVDVDRIVFLPHTTTTTPPPTRQEEQKPFVQPPSMTTLDHYWYIYITVFVMVVLLMLSLLFMTIRPQQPLYIISK